MRSVFDSAAGRILSHPSIATMGSEELVAISKKVGGLMKQFQYEYSTGPLPSEQATLFWFGLKLTGTVAEPVVRELLSGEGAAPTFRLTPPALIAGMETSQSAVTPTTTPRRTYSAPTINQLRNQGYTNILDVRLDEENKVYRFACNDPNIDLVGMTRQQMVDYAKENPGAIRIFEVNERGYATREVRPSSL
jgi:hypothetical protein